jgi:hypothetical protein
MSRPEVQRDWRWKGLLAVEVLKFRFVEFEARKGGVVESVELVVVVFVEFVERSSRNNLLISGEVVLDEGFVVDVDIVLLDGKVNLGVSLLRMGLEVIDLVVVDNVDTAADLLELMIGDDSERELEAIDLLVVDEEVETTGGLLELVLVDDLGRELELVKDFEFLGTQAFVFGVYNGPSGG